MKANLPAIEGVGTAVPGEGVLQADVRRKAEDVLAALAPELLDKMAVFDTVGIRKRHFVRPLDWYLESHGWEERSQVYATEGLDLCTRAAKDALAAANVPASAIDGVILVSTTGIATPSLDARLIETLGLRPDVTRVPVWGLGCAGGVAGLNLAADLARAHPERRYLLVTMEICSLAFNLSDLSVRAFVANTLFADGAAAVVVRGGDLAGPALAHIRAATRHTWPATGNVMGWDVRDDGLRVVFSRRIPEIITANFEPIVAGFAKRENVELPSARLVFHPGGTKVLEAYAEALKQPDTAFDSARDALREFGNMSSPTVLFVLKDVLSRAPLARGEPAFLAALGPGFSAELALIEG